MGRVRAFDGEHDRDRFAQFFEQQLSFPNSNAVLSGAGAVHSDGTLVHPQVQCLGLGDLFRAAGIDRDLSVNDPSLSGNILELDEGGRVVHAPGEKLFVDYAGHTVPIVDQQSRIAHFSARWYTIIPAS